MVGDPGTDAVSTKIVVGANTLEASRTSEIDSSPRITDLVRSIISRDAGTRVTAATLDMGQASDPLSQYLYDTAGRLARQWGTTGEARDTPSLVSRTTPTATMRRAGARRPTSHSSPRWAPPAPSSPLTPTPRTAA